MPKCDSVSVPAEFLSRLAKLLNRLAVSRDVGTENLLLLNELRQQLFTMLPDPIEAAILTRSTDGPSLDEVLKRGYQLGLQAVLQIAPT